MATAGEGEAHLPRVLTPQAKQAGQVPFSFRCRRREGLEMPQLWLERD